MAAEGLTEQVEACRIVQWLGATRFGETGAFDRYCTVGIVVALYQLKEMRIDAS
jgi:hypothetical protein